MRATSFGLTLGVLLGCQDTAGGPDVAEPVTAVEATTAEEPTPASAEEIADICRAYRKALRSRWDDQRTRQEVRGLELQADEAIAWQVELASGDTRRALAATRAVVAAAEQHDLTSACEPLASLVRVAETMMDVPDGGR